MLHDEIVSSMMTPQKMGVFREEKRKANKSNRVMAILSIGTSLDLSSSQRASEDRQLWWNVVVNVLVGLRHR